jgi:hypothetical protein
MVALRRLSPHFFPRLITLSYFTAVITGIGFCREADRTAPGELSPAEKKIQEAILRGQSDPILLTPPDNVVDAQVLVKWIVAPPSNEESAPLQIRIKGAEIINDLDLSDREIVREVTFIDCTIDGEVTFERSDAKRSLSFIGSTFNRSPTFQDAAIEGDFELTGTQFLDEQRPVNFQRIALGSEFHLQKAVFSGGADFYHSHWKGLVHMDGTRFGKDVRFDNLKSEDDILGDGVIFDGKVSFDSAEAKGIYLWRCKFAGSCEFRRNTISRSIGFRNDMFGDHFSFQENSIDQNLDLTNAQFIKRHSSAVTPTTENGLIDVDLSRTHVGAFTQFNNATISGFLSLEECDLHDLNLEGVQPWRRDKRMTRLTNSTIRRFDGRSARDFLLFVDRSEFDRGVYSQLESFLKAEGQSDDANQVFIHQQTRDRHTKSSVTARLKNWIWFLVSGYGREPWLALVWSAGVVAFGSILFWRSSDMQLRDGKFAGRKYNPIWFSLDLFAPIIDLESASVWCPRSDRFGKWFYFRVHRILGWILVPIGIVAITGVLQGGSQ